MTELAVRTEPLGGSRLARAAQGGQLPADWFLRAPASPDAWRARARAVATEFAGRAWLDALSPAFGADGAAAERLRAVAAGNGIVVTTGQQPGLFGGPLLTFAKALTALALANELERVSGVPAAPVFWAATDDADFAEAAVTRVVFDATVETLALEPSAASGTPTSRVPLRNVEPLVRRFLEACGSAADSRTAQAVTAAYRDGQTVGGAYVQLLRELLQPLGVAVLDAAHPCVRAAGAPLLGLAVERAETVAHAVRERDAALRAAGFEPQVEEVAGLGLVFAWENGIKRRLRIGEAAPEPGAGGEALSPTVLLRPVMERSILPTAAYVGGPAELSYFAQASAVAAALDAPVPLAVPRWSVTIVEPRVQRLIERLGVQLDALREPGVLESEKARERIPAASREALAQLRAVVEQGIAGVRAASADLLAPETVEGARRAILHRIARLERRHAAAVSRREVQLMREIAAVRAAIFPDGARQERSVAYTPYLARHGQALTDAMAREAAAHARALVMPGGAPHGGAAPPAMSRQG